MKVLYDYPALSQIHGGVSRYICEIVKVLESEIEIDMSILYTDNIYLEELQFPGIRRFITKNDFKGKRRIQRIINTFFSNYKIIRNNYDLFHATYSDPYFLLKPKKPVVVTIHDMINEKLPEYHKSHAKHIASKKNLIYNSDHIIAISENTKKDILELYSIPPEKITVIYHGAPTASKEAVKNEYGKYLLFVGRRTRYKNFTFFVESIAPILLEDKHLNLVCVGPVFTPSEEEFLKELGIRHQVTAVSVPDPLLFSLYRNALAFVFPSLFEGFGIPILEAFASNCPVCLSNSSCFPEIAGDAAVYFDPGDKQSILESVQRVIHDKELASEITRRGRQRLPLFSWDTAARETLQVYNSVL